MKVCFKPIKFSLINQNRFFRLSLKINRYAFVIFQNFLPTCVLVSTVCVPRRLSQRNKDLWRLCYLYFTCLVQFVQFSVSVVWFRSRSSLICANFSLSLISIFITNVSSQFKPILFRKHLVNSWAQCVLKCNHDSLMQFSCTPGSWIDFDIMVPRYGLFFFPLPHSRYSLETEESYGSQYENGSWYGMVGLVNQQVCQF